MSDPRHRRLGLLAGPLGETAAAALALTSEAPDGLWVGEAPADWPHARCDARGLRGWLGRDVAALVLDDPDPEALGRAHGCVRGGGRLIVRLSPTATPSRWRRRLEAAIERAGGGRLSGPCPAPANGPTGTADQGAAVDVLRHVFGGRAGGVATLVADRGRGKSAALGLALRGFEDQAAVTGPRPSAVDEVRRFCPDLGFTPLQTLLDGEVNPAVIAVDEAAQLPVTALRQLMLRHPRARIAFATTTRGYEGTGRGFVLRFLAWLEAHQRARRRPYVAPTLRMPIRWAADDPVERFVFDALLLDARPSAFGPAEDASTAEVRTLDRDRLAADEPLLRAVFGLLVHAHYRTTPGDLALLLDGPGVTINAALMGGRVAAVNLLVREGRLDPTLAEQLFRGTANVPGQALPETLAADCGRPDAAALDMLRSVRIAAHPALRRQGLARRLVDAAHASAAPDLFGTLFGATPALLEFRRQLGYRLVRVGISGGARAGEPAAVMIRAVSTEARRLVAALRRDLARGLPRQLELMATDQILAPALMRAACVDLPEPPPRDAAWRDESVAAYAFGPRGFESAAHALLLFVDAHRDALAGLDPADARLVRDRVLAGQSWRAVARQHGSVRAAMRGLRRAVRQLTRQVAPHLEDRFGEPAPAHGWSTEAEPSSP